MKIRSNLSSVLLEAIVGLSLSFIVSLPIFRSIFGVTQIFYLFPIIFLLTLVFVVRGKSKLIFPRPVRHYVTLGVMLYILLLLTSYWSVSTGQVTTDIILIFYLIAIFIIVPFTVTSKVLNWTLNGIIAIGLFVAIAVFFGYYEAGSLRGYGTYVHEFYLTASSLLGAAFVASVVQLSVSRKAKWWRIIVALTLTGGLSLSLGRMSLLSGFLVVLVFSLFGLSHYRHVKLYPKIDLRTLALTVGIFMLAVGLIWGSVQVERTKKRLQRLIFSPVRELVSGGRGKLWMNSWASITYAPAWGHGLGSNGLMSGGSDGGYPHNMFLQVGIDAGVIGLILLSLTVFYPFVFFWFRRKTEGGRKALPFFAVYAYYLLKFQTSSNAYSARPLFLMGMMTIFAVLFYNVEEFEKSIYSDLS